MDIKNASHETVLVYKLTHLLYGESGGEYDLNVGTNCSEAIDKDLFMDCFAKIEAVFSESKKRKL